MYTVTFKLEGKSFELKNMDVRSDFYGFDEQFVTSRMADKKRKHPRENLNIAYQVLSKYEGAYDIIVTNNGKSILAFAILLVLLLFGAIVQAFYMFGHPKKNNLFKNVLNIEQYQRFRKLYLIIGSIVYTLFLAFFIVTLIVLKNLSTLSVFLLAGYNIAYFIAAVVVGHKIWKKYHVDEPELPPESSNASIPQSVEKVEEGTEADELIKYKRLYENGIISKADFNKKKKEILFGKKINSPEDKEKKRKITLIVLTSLAIAAFFVGFMLGLFEEYKYMKERYTLLDAFGTDKGLGIALLLILLSLSMLAFESLILVDAIKPLFKRKLKIIFASVATGSCFLAALISLIAWGMKGPWDGGFWAIGVMVFMITSFASLPFAASSLVLTITKKEEVKE